MSYRFVRIARVRELITVMTLADISLHIHFPVGLDACVPEDSPGVFRCSVLLHVRTQRPAHHLEEASKGMPSLVGDGANSPFEEFFACRGTLLHFVPQCAIPDPQVGDMSAACLGPRPREPFVSFGCHPGRRKSLTCVILL